MLTATHRNQSTPFRKNRSNEAVVWQMPNDLHIELLVRQALQANQYRQLRSLHAYCDHGRITLQGQLPTFYLKQVAQEAVLSVPGVRDIDNDIHVCRH